VIIYEFKVKGKDNQYRAIDDAIRTSQFIQNKCLRQWMDIKGLNKYDLNKYCAVLAAEFPFASELNSMARQSAAERAWSAISRFYDNCKRRLKTRAFQSSRKTAVLLNTKQAGGCFLRTGRPLLLGTKRG
jgi:putative transposase